MTPDPMSAPEWQYPRTPGDERFDEDVPPEDYGRQLVLRLAPEFGLTLAQTVVDLMKLMFQERRP